MSPSKYDDVAKHLTGSSRFGHTSDITSLFGTKEESEDYLTGLAFAAGILVAICFIWLSLILLFWLCGQKRTGWLSGKALHKEVDTHIAKLMVSHAATQRQGENGMEATNTEDKDITMMGSQDKNEDEREKNTNTCAGSSTENDCKSQGGTSETNEENSMMKYYHEETSLRTRPTRMRAIFLLCGVLFIACSILAVTRGLMDLQTTVDTVNYNARSVNELSLEANEILQAVQDIRGTTIAVRNQMVSELSRENFCPGDKQLKDTTTAAKIMRQANDLVPLLEDLKDFVSGDLDDIHSSAKDIRKTATDIESETEVIEVTSWSGLAILAPFTLIPAILMASTIFAMYDVEFRCWTRFTNWIVFPLFLLITILSCASAAAMLIGGSMNADFCLPAGQSQENSVDNTVFRLLEREGYASSTFEYRIADFYMSECQSTDDPLQFLRDFIPQLSESEGHLIDLYEKTNDGNALQELREECGREFVGIDTLIEKLIDLIGVVSESLDRTLELASCDNIVPIYMSVVHKGTCSSSLAALLWILFGFFSTGFFGLIMITLRSSYKQTVYSLPDDVDPKNESEADILRKDSTKELVLEESSDADDGHSTSEGTEDQKKEEEAQETTPEGAEEDQNKQEEAQETTEKPEDQQCAPEQQARCLLSGDMVDPESLASGDDQQVHRLSI